MKKTLKIMNLICIFCLRIGSQLTLYDRSFVPTNSVSLHTARKQFIYLLTCIFTPYYRDILRDWHPV